MIFFTPRSGSSWLTDILSQTQCLGRANELFNPNFLPRTAVALQAGNLDDYVHAARRRLNVGGTLSFEITMHQLQAVFKSEEDFHRHFGNGRFVWLTSRDIVAQAVSLAKMVRAKIAHSPHVTEADIKAADNSFTYSGSEIRKWIGHIRRAEEQTDAFMSRHGLRPLRLVYESMMEEGTTDTIHRIASHADVALPPDLSITETHRKLGTATNEEFADRFKRRHRLLMLRLAWQRRDMFPDR